MKVTKKNQDWLVFLEIANRTYTEELGKTKFGTQLKKQVKVVSQALESYREKLEDLRIDHCSVDEKNNILRDKDQHYVFTKDQLKAFSSASRKLLQEDLEITVFLSEDYIKQAQLKSSEEEYFLEIIGVLDSEEVGVVNPE